jgi:hypothetical protein
VGRAGLVLVSAFCFVLDWVSEGAATTMFVLGRVSLFGGLFRSGFLFSGG